MADQSHREEMNAAIRAQRERSAVPKTIAPEPRSEQPPRTETPSPEAPRSFLRRLRGTSSR